MSFSGVIGTEEARWLWPDSRLLGAAWTRGVPVEIEVADDGLVLSPRTRLLRGERWAPVTLAWDELAGATATSRGHTGLTGGLTLHETFDVNLKVVGWRAAGFEMPEISSFLPGFPSADKVVDDLHYAPLRVTMAHGDDLAAAVNARAKGKRASSPEVAAGQDVDERHDRHDHEDAPDELRQPVEVVPAEEVDPREHDGERMDEADEEFEKLLHGLRVPTVRRR